MPLDTEPVDYVKACQEARERWKEAANDNYTNGMSVGLLLGAFILAPVLSILYLWLR